MAARLSGAVPSFASLSVLPECDQKAQLAALLLPAVLSLANVRAADVMDSIMGMCVGDILGLVDDDAEYVRR